MIEGYFYYLNEDGLLDEPEKKKTDINAVIAKLSSDFTAGRLTEDEFKRALKVALEGGNQ